MKLPQFLGVNGRVPCGQVKHEALVLSDLLHFRLPRSSLVLSSAMLRLKIFDCRSVALPVDLLCHSEADRVSAVSQVTISTAPILIEQSTLDLGV
jgi:hypothetical protein